MGVARSKFYGLDDIGLRCFNTLVDSQDAASKPVGLSGLRHCYETLMKRLRLHYLARSRCRGRRTLGPSRQNGRSRHNSRQHSRRSTRTEDLCWLSDAVEGAKSGWRWPPFDWRRFIPPTTSFKPVRHESGFESAYLKYPCTFERKSKQI